MKKLITGISVLLVFIMLYVAGADSTKANDYKMRLTSMTVNDTVPRDTTKKDSMLGLLSYNTKDTVPKDTTRKDTEFASAVAYRLVTDTVPSDTTKKDTMFQDLAYNR